MHATFDWIYNRFTGSNDCSNHFFQSGRCQAFIIANARSNCFVFLFFFPSFFSGSIQVVYFRVHFFWENPKKEFWSRIIWIFHHQKSGRSKKNYCLLWQRAGTEAREGYLRFFRHCVDKHGVELVCFGKILQWKSAARAFPAPKRRSCFAPYSRKFEEERTYTYPILLWFGFSQKRTLN